LHITNILYLCIESWYTGWVCSAKKTYSKHTEVSMREMDMKRWPTKSDDPELQANNALGDDRIVNHLLEPQGYTPMVSEAASPGVAAASPPGKTDPSNQRIQLLASQAPFRCHRFLNDRCRNSHCPGFLHALAGVAGAKPGIAMVEHC
jgi:hypothetical protein